MMKKTTQANFVLKLVFVFFAFLAGLATHAQCANYGTGATQDFDCDGVINSLDLDDDNDGILDTAECDVTLAATTFNLFAPPSYYQNTLGELWNIAISGASGTVITFNNTTYTIPASGALVISIDGNVVPDLSENVVQSGKSLPLTATGPITIVHELTGDYVSDSWIVLPEKTWGTSYRLFSYTYAGNNQYAMIYSATDENQVVIKNKAGVVQKTLILDAGETYLQSGNSLDMTGWTVTSTEKVGVIVGVQCTNAPGGGACDNIDEMLLPTPMLGTKYYIPNGANNTTYVMAEIAGTTVDVNGVTVATLANPGDTYSFNVSTTALNIVETNNDVTVWQLSPNDYDPAWALVLDENSAVKSFNFATPASMISTSVLSLIVPTASTSLIRYNGNPVLGWVTYPSEPSVSYTEISGIPAGASISITSTTNNVPLLSSYTGSGPYITTSTAPSIGNYNILNGLQSLADCTDTDEDGNPDYVDLDSDNDGCSDANEAYGLATANGADGNMYYGDGNPPAVNADGTVVGALYATSSINVTTAGVLSTISTQPVDTTGLVDGNVTFSVTAAGGTGTTQYQWQESTDNGNTWADIANGGVYSDATTSALTITGVTSAMNGYDYRVIISQSNFVCNMVTSNGANLCIVSEAVAVTEPLTSTCTAITVVGNTPQAGTGTGEWSIVSGTGGSFSSTANTTTTFTGTPEATYTIRWTITNGSCSSSDDITMTLPSAPVATQSQTNVACNGGSTGSASVTATGGTGAYTYVWSPSGGTAATATGLTAGSYSVLITDANGCAITKNFTITQPAALVTTPSQTNVSCNGGTNGSATVSATGGTGTYTYVWSPSGGTAATASGLAAGTYTVTVTDANGCIATQSFTITQPAVLAATQSQTNVACNGGSTGSASVTATGGTGAYTYVWSPSGGTAATATGLTAGSYSVLITDANGCILTKNFTITQPAALVITPSQTNVSCNGGTNGSATVTATGGAGTYTYSWAPTGGTAATATGLAAGTYTVTVTDANGCIATQSITLTQPAVLAATQTQTNVSCNGGTNGSATVSATGGTGTYTYVWSPSGGTAATASGLAAGAYSVLITDANGCILTKSFTITQPAVLAATQSQTNVACNGGSTGSATVTTTGGTGAYTYVWSPSGGTAATATGLAAGGYTVTITDANGCVLTKTFTITQPAVLAATQTQVNVSCNGGSNASATVTTTGGTGTYTYNWTPGNPTGDGTATVTGLTAGTWNVAITDANGCTLTKSFTITQPAVLAATQTQTNVSCNGGTNGSATVTTTGGTGTYTYAWAPSGGTAATATGLAAGAYTVTITDANGCTLTKSFTITQPAALAATQTQVNVLCNGNLTGSATVTTTGGTGTYTYAWAPSGGTAATATGLATGTYTVTITDANGCVLTKTFTITQPTALAATQTQVNVSCNGGANASATVVTTGGTGAYTYNWAPGNPTGEGTATATGLTAGTWTVTITDANGCVLTKSFTITQPAVLAATQTQVNVSCNGGTNASATVAVTGGTGTYTYAWSPSGGTAATATGLAAGAYTVLITDANGCTLTKSFTITQPAALAATQTQTNILCNGGANASATVAVTGGTGTYTYNWAPGNPTGEGTATATGLTAGAWTVTITDANGCVLTKSFTITQPAVLAATQTQVNVSCNGGTNASASVAVTGGAGTYTYTWSPSGGTAATATGLAAGAYSVLITDANGCTLTKSFTITQPAALVATQTQVNVSCNGGSNASATVAVTGGTGTYTYNWAPGNPTGEGTATATGLAAGTWTVTITDVNGCVLTKSFSITQPTVLAASAVQNSTATCVESTNGSATATATGGTGTYTYLWDNGAITATATNLSVATHTVTVTDANGCTVTATVVIGFSDTVPPVPALATLPTITAQCVVTAADVPVPTATDNCVGTVAVTTDAVFPFTVQGTAVITWTYTDVNGNTTTQTQDITLNDTTNPVPAVAQLPAISMQCGVLTSDIPVPTATDNCAGVLNATTTDPLAYTDLGTNTITWTYDDGNGNTITQTQSVTVTESVINAVTFTGQTFVYNTQAQGITVDNLPAGASVSYSVSPETGLVNEAINAGVYTVTAVVTPAADAPNCDPVTLTATITINQAEQQIIFDPLAIMNLETDPDFQLMAYTTSGLPVYYTYTYTGTNPPATVTPQGWVDMLTSGLIQITAHQDGDANYLPATVVTQPLQINSSDSTIHSINIDGTEYESPQGNTYYLMACENTADAITVMISTEANATVDMGHEFTISTPQPGIYNQTVTVTSQDGTTTNTYNITVERMFPFFDIAVQKFDNVLLANNNPATNGGYSFVAYEWYRNGTLVSTEQYFSEGPTNNDLLDPTAEYYLKLTTVGGDVLQTCVAHITLEHNYRLSVTPNPARSGKLVTVTVDFPAAEINNMQVDIFDMMGRSVYTTHTSQRITEIQLPGTMQAATYLVMCTTPNYQKTFKIIVSE